MKSEVSSRILIVMLLGIFIIALASAEQMSLGTFKSGDCITLKQTCSNCSIVNITSVLLPNNTASITNVAMTKVLTEFSYNYCTNITGTYVVNGFGDPDGTLTVWAYDFLVTGNGNPLPDGTTITFFSIIFLLIIMTLAYLIIYSIGHAVTLDFDIIDLAWNFGIYFGFVGTYMLAQTYLGDLKIIGILDWVVYITALTNIILPMIYFILTLTIGTYMQRRVKGVDY